MAERRMKSFKFQIISVFELRAPPKQASRKHGFYVPGTAPYKKYILL